MYPSNLLLQNKLSILLKFIALRIMKQTKEKGLTYLVFLACSLMYQGLLPWNRSCILPLAPGMVGQSMAL